MKAFLIETAAARRTCTNCCKPILKNEKCITFRHGSGVHAVSANLCKTCIAKVDQEMNGNELKDS